MNIKLGAMGKKKQPQTFPFMKLLVIPRPLRKWMFCQLVGVVVLVWLWIHFNGGLLPFFLRKSSADFKSDTKTNVLLYYSESRNDASRIKWARGVNSKSRLASVLNSDTHIIEADISLRGQGTKSQQLLPVMAQPPDTDSDLTFDMWVNEIALSRKAIKLDFHAVEAVEIVLQKLKSKLKETRRPIWLHADVLHGPHAQRDPVDGILFMRAVKRFFPDATVSLGWTTRSLTDVSQTGYTWSAVMDMYAFMEANDLVQAQPVTVSVRLSLVENSVLQLKWLCDNTDASLTVFHSDDDEPMKQNTMYAAFKFAPDKLFFDLNHSEMEKHIRDYRHFSKERVNPLVHEREMLAFRPKAWLKVGFHQHIRAIMPSEDAAILLTPDVHLLTKTKYEPSEKIRLYGRVMFLNRNNAEAQSTSGLQIYFRADQISHPDDLIGLRVLIGVHGNIKVESVGIGPDMEPQSTNVTPTSAYCYRFGIVNKERELLVRVSALSNCETLANFHEVNKVHAELKVAIPKYTPTNERPIAVKVVDRTRAAVVDQLIVEYAADSVFTHPI